MPTKKLISRAITFLLMFALTFSAAGIIPAQAVGFRYAKPSATGTGNCLSWANACRLQTALSGAVSGNEVWVAEGTHKPTTTTDRAVTFQLKNGVAIYGGFTGTETARSQRDPATHITILSGDLGIAVSNDNSYHVVTGANGASMDGFTITSGNADGSSPNNFGGGMLNNGVSPLLTNITFDSNLATYGGGMMNYNHSSPTLTWVTFNGHSAEFGGGMYNDNGSNPTLTNVTFSYNHNWSTGDGGGMYNNSSSPTLTKVTFNGNATTGRGGGMYNNSSNPILTDVTFSSNTALYGGGMYNNTASSPTLTNVTFSSNTANGGGMYNDKDSNPTLMNVTFDGNTAAGVGGGLVNSNDSSPTLTNVTFSGNTAGGGSGGGMYNGKSSSPTLMNVTFSGNSAGWGGGMENEYSDSNPTLTNVTFSGNSATHGGGLSNFSSNSPQIRNTIFWGNTATTDGAQISVGTSILDNSVVQDGCPAGNICTNIITADPLLGSLGDYGGFTQTIPLLEGSSAIDTGNDDVCPSTDQRGNSRPQGIHCDIGAFEDGYTLTITSAKGTVIKDPDKATYHEGDVVQLTATPATGWRFSKWSGGLTGATNPASITIHGNTSITANYLVIQQRAKNGGFNTYPTSTAKIPTNWKAVNFVPTDGKNSQYKQEGNYSVKIAGAAGKTKTLTQTLTLSGVKGDTFTFSFWAKGSAIPAEGVCKAEVLLYNSLNKLVTSKVVNCKTGTYAAFIQNKALPFSATAAYSKVVIKFIYSKPSGTVWLDVVSLMR
jgi:hypothetical protein